MSKFIANAHSTPILHLLYLPTIGPGLLATLATTLVTVLPLIVTAIRILPGIFQAEMSTLILRVLVTPETPTTFTTLMFSLPNTTVTVVMAGLDRLVAPNLTAVLPSPSIAPVMYLLLAHSVVPISILIPEEHRLI